MTGWVIWTIGAVVLVAFVALLSWAFTTKRPSKQSGKSARFNLFD